MPFEESLSVLPIIGTRRHSPIFSSVVIYTKWSTSDSRIVRRDLECMFQAVENILVIATLGFEVGQLRGRSLD